MMVGRILSDEHRPGNGRDPIRADLQGSIPKVLRLVLLADEETGMPTKARGAEALSVLGRVAASIDSPSARAKNSRLKAPNEKTCGARAMI
jgi:hypothetical protein